jgi:hypothetical protein
MSARGSITGKVARILNSRELVFNRGAADGVNLGMKFAVLDPKGENITDPDTGDVLGSLHRPKVKVEVVKVEDKMSVARTYAKKTVNLGGSSVVGGGLSAFLMPPRYVTRFQTFKTDESTWEDIDESESIVKTGDLVEEISEESEELDEAD